MNELNGSGVQREEWSSRFAFVMAAVGSAIGLGNVWRFPWLVAQNGGAAFVFVYLALLVFIGYPILLAELTIGRAARRAPHVALGTVSGKPFWNIVGWLGIFAGGIFVLSYYNVVGGWTIKYMILSLTGLIEEANAGNAGSIFGTFVGAKHEQVGFMVLFMAVVMFYIARGVKSLEWANKWMMGTLFVLVLVLVARSLTLDNREGVMAGINYYLNPDFTKVTFRTCLSALGQVFFSLSLGLGAMLIYGSYVKKEENIPAAAGWTAGLDTGVSLLAGLIIFPAVFALMGAGAGEAATKAGPGLTFIVLPEVFAKMPFANSLFSFLFFLLLFCGAATSAMSLMEVAAGFAAEKFGLKRAHAVYLMGTIIILLGGYSAISLSGDPKVFAPWAGKLVDFFDFMDELCNNVVMPLGSMLLCLFVGWVWCDPALKEITNDGKLSASQFALTIWIWVLRIFAPVAIAIIGLTGLGVIKIG